LKQLKGQIVSNKQHSTIELSSLSGSDREEPHSIHQDRFEGIRTRRIIAYAIDVVCIFFLGIIATIAATLMGIVTLGLLSPILAVGLALVPLAYHTVTIGSEKNATLGMQLMKIEVYLKDGRSVDYLTAFFHAGLFYASMAITSMLILGVSLFNSQGRLLHDYLTNSGVRNTRN
jgi:uncharacterized RDD family membrane protein YckC